MLNQSFKFRLFLPVTTEITKIYGFQQFWSQTSVKGNHFFLNLWCSNFNKNVEWYEISFLHFVQGVEVT